VRRALIITYDLDNPGQNYEELLKLIKGYGSWAKLGGSSYLISTESTPVQVRDHLQAVLDRNDKLFVGLSPPPSAWRGMSDDVSKWIQANQK
jgi:hypothetical protein